VSAPVVDPDALLRKPFDHYGRYRLAADVVRAVTAPGATVLDVGGGPGSLAAFVPDRRIVASDLRHPGEWYAAAPDLVLADGAALPFPDGAFDAIVSLDTLEHVPQPVRARLLAEATRVSRGWVLVVCPCATEGVAEADEALRGVVRARFGDDFPTVGVLDEHLGFGHPNPEATQAALEAGGAEVVRLPSGRLDRWLPMMLLFYDLLALGVDDPVERVQAWYNARWYTDDLRAPSYRTAFLGRVGGGASGPPPAEVAAALLPEGPPLPGDADHLDALRHVLGESLAPVLAAERRRTADLDARLAAAGAELQRAQAEAAASALRAAQNDADLAAARADATGARADAAIARTAAAVAEERAAALEAFRRRVLDHPVLRARRAALRLARRRPR